MQSERYELCVRGDEKNPTGRQMQTRAIGGIELHVSAENMAGWGGEKNIESVAIVVNYESIRAAKNRPRFTRVSFNRS